MNYSNQSEMNQHQQTNMPHGSQERMKSFQNSMVVLWQSMGRLFHPQWTKNNGEIGSPAFQDWTRELQYLGSKGVLKGLDSVRCSGRDYAPSLNKFIGFCRDEIEGGGGTDLSYSETQHGGQLKPTPNGVPLSWTTENYSYEELMASGHPEDAERARSAKGKQE